MKRTALQCGNAFMGELTAAVNQTGQFGAVLHGFARNVVVVGFVGLAQVGGVGIGQCALEFHPVQGGTGVEAAGKGDTDLVPEGQALQNGAHGGLAPINQPKWQM